MSTNQCRKFIVRGRVQGVGFRYHTYQAGQKIGVVGHVRNLVDGSVEAVVGGSASQLQEFRKVISRGPTFARVDEVVEEAIADYRLPDRFEIKD